MSLARELHKSLAEILALDSRELGLWIALARQEAEEAHLQNLAAKADAARMRK